MRTRRDMLRTTLVLPCLKLDLPRQAQQPTIIVEPHVLSRESAAHFQTLLNGCKVTPRDLVVLPAARELTTDLARRLGTRASSGAWLILESGLCFTTPVIRQQQTRLWATEFGLSFGTSSQTTQLYVEYLWPSRQIIRTFGACTPLSPISGEIIAHSGDAPVCCIRRVGRGGILFLGSMLGPGLAAGEREAHRLALTMVESIANET
jgi:hypothetical protein